MIPQGSRWRKLSIPWGAEQPRLQFVVGVEMGYFEDHQLMQAPNSDILRRAINLHLETTAAGIHQYIGHVGVVIFVVVLSLLPNLPIHQFYNRFTFPAVELTIHLSFNNSGSRNGDGLIRNLTSSVPLLIHSDQRVAHCSFVFRRHGRDTEL
jgi:hypothetical protein